jgi:hypothetical protein
VTKPALPPEADLRIDTGRADQGRTFIRVVHMPTGLERTRVGLSGTSSCDVIRELTEEIAALLAAHQRKDS